MRFKGFNPCFNSECDTLILGSFPSVKSRQNDFYYGNSQNRFWKTISSFFNAPLPVSNDEKRQLLLTNHIALWDMVSECEIVGSLDSNIKNYTVADLYEVLKNAPIKKIILNGRKSQEIFNKNYPELKYIAIYLPSTSPANTRFDINLWFNALGKNTIDNW